MNCTCNNYKARLVAMSKYLTPAGSTMQVCANCGRLPPKVWTDAEIEKWASSPEVNKTFGELAGGGV